MVITADALIGKQASELAHWCMTDVNFDALRDEFEKLFNEILEQILLLTDRLDKVSEHICQSGTQAITIVNDFVDKASLSEATTIYPNIGNRVATQVSNHATVIEFLQGDIATFDENAGHEILVHLLACLQKQQKLVWILQTWMESQISIIEE